MAKEEYEMPQSDSDVESESGEEDRKSDNKLLLFYIFLLLIHI
jgi:hypothetical protein